MEAGSGQLRFQCPNSDTVVPLALKAFIWQVEPLLPQPQACPLSPA